MMPIVDFTGDVVKGWTVLKRFSPAKPGEKTMYSCRHTCGNVELIRHDTLKLGSAPWCGCETRRIPRREAPKHLNPTKPLTTLDWRYKTVLDARAGGTRWPEIAEMTGLTVEECKEIAA